MTSKDELQFINYKLAELLAETKVASAGQLALKEDLDALKHSIIGNGKPGLMTRVDRLEQVSKFKGAIAWLVFGATTSGIGAIIVFYITKQ